MNARPRTTSTSPSLARASSDFVSLRLRRAVFAAALPLVVGALPVFLTGALGVRLQEELGFGEVELGFAVGTVPATGVIATIAMGRVVHRLGAATGLRIGAAVSMVSLLGAAVFATGFGMLLVFLVVGGVGLAVIMPASDSWIARMVTPSRQGLAMGLKQAAPQTAGLLAGLAVPALAVTVGWRWAFAAGAVLALAGIFVVPRGSAGGKPSRNTAREGDVPWRTLMILAVAMALGQMSGFSLIGFSVSTAVDAGGSESVAGAVFMAGSITGIATRMRIGHLADVRSRNQLYVAAGMLSAGAMCYLLMATGNPVVVFAVIPVAFATGGSWGGLVLLSVIRANPSAPALASSVVVWGANVGAFIGPFVFGALAARSFTTAWIVAAGVALCGAVAMAVTGHIVARSSSE